MKTRSGSLLILVALLLSARLLCAGDPGSTGFAFLKVSRAARSAGMGDAGVALPSGLWGSHLNPASLSAGSAPCVSFMHHEHIFDARHEFAAVAVPLAAGSVGAGLDFFKVGDLEYREAATEEPVGVFDAQDYSWFAGYGAQVGSRLAVGVVAKYLAERIESETADAVAVDIGGVWRLTNSLTLGAAVRNFGSKPRFRSEDIDLPTIISAGAGLEIKELAVAADLCLPKDGDARVNVGAERYVADFLALRAGYKFGYDEEDLSFGIGFLKNIWQIDYAFVPYGSGLGSSHRFALTIYWR